MATQTTSGQPLRFWLLPGPSARVAVSPGHHVIVDLTVHDGRMVELDDRELNDDETLREAIQSALDGKRPAGYQGSEALTAAQAAADAAWDAHVHCAACGTSVPSRDWLSREGWCTPCFTAKAPQWLETLRMAGAL